MQGRKRKPNALKILQGEKRKSRLNKKEPKPDNQVPAIPKAVDPLGIIGKQEWERVTKQLYDLKMIADIDLATVYAYCHSFEQFVETAEQLKKLGYLVKAPSGYPIINPLISINNEAKRQLKAFISELGLSPASRSRVKIEGPEESEGKFAKFINGGKKQSK